MTAYYAHSTNDVDKTHWQPLKTHLINVAQITSTFAQDCGAKELGYAAGLLHDLGKYSQEFQKRLEGHAIMVDHSTAGARECRSHYPTRLSRILEYTITGHHGGLLNYGSNVSGLVERLNKAIPDYSSFKDEIHVPKLENIRPKLRLLQNSAGFSISFYTRMLYSCLVDADSLDTEYFCAPSKANLRGMYDPFNALAERFDEYMSLISSSSKQSRINHYRREIFNQCKAKAALPPQMFTLTVPTGGGKTLSSMAFALEHLKRYDLKRIFYVIPYTSIIEQNAAIFREIFGSRNVLEHHSNFDPKDMDYENLDTGEESFILATENWDMPIVVTTNVQFFESLFSNRRTRCRKLHNLARSVIILDEAQMLPTGYLRPCLVALSELVRNYGSSVVICTATQPKLAGLLDESIKPVEIIYSPQELYEAFKRVNVQNLSEMNDAELSIRLKEHHQVLCIVNTRAHAKKLYDSISDLENSYHLSARMCPTHRRHCLAIIREQLNVAAPCRLISTQLIEAGVDIDFPVVYRAMAGIDSIAQAAGRCNREGKRASGDVYVFKSSEAHGKAKVWQRRTAEIGEMVMKDSQDPLSLSSVATYFQKLYFYEGDAGLDQKGILTMLEEPGNELSFPFKDVSENFRIIEDDTRDLIIPYDDKAVSIIEGLRNTMIPRQYARKIQGYSISIYQNEFDDLVNSGSVETIHDRFYVLTDMEKYSESTGLVQSKDKGIERSLLIA